MNAITSPAGASDDTTAVDPAVVINQLNAFFCEEIAAETAYGMAADRARSGDSALYRGLLRQFQEEHSLAAEAIRDQIQELGGETTDTCGSFGAWGLAAQGTESFFGQNRPGKPSTLEYLKSGEEHNLTGYQDGIKAVDTLSAQLLRNLLIPAQRRHINVLHELLGTESAAS